MASKSHPQRGSGPRQPVDKSGNGAESQPAGEVELDKDEVSAEPTVTAEETSAEATATNPTADVATPSGKEERQVPRGSTGPRRGRGGKKVTSLRSSGGPGRKRTITAAKAGRMATSTIVMFVVVGIVALSIIGYAIYQSYDANRPFGQQRAQQVDGMTNYRQENPKMLSRKHVAGNVDYAVTPAVGGDHNEQWQNCEGAVYGDQIPDEHAVHSLEHGAVWITYTSDLPKGQIDKLAKKVRGQDYMLMSPHPGLKSSISLQAWGFQLKVDSADDPRIDEFIVALRKDASVEPGSNCASELTATGDQPLPPQPGGVPGVPQIPGGAQLPGGAPQ